MKDKCEFFQELTNNTILDPNLANRFIPIEYWEEYEKQKSALNDFVKDKKSKIVLLLPFEKPQLNLPLVSLFVWSKVSILINSKYSDRIDIKWVYSPSIHEILKKDTSKKVIDIWRKLGIYSSEILTTTLRDQIDDNKIIGQACVKFLENYISGPQKVDENTIADLLNALCMVSYTIINRGNLILCGQDRAPLYNVMLKYIRTEAGLDPSPFPTGLYMPFINFPNGAHVGFHENSESIHKKVYQILKTLPSRQNQINWVIDVVRSANCIPSNELFEDYIKQVEMCYNLFDIASLCAKKIDSLMTSLKR